MMRSISDDTNNFYYIQLNCTGYNAIYFNILAYGCVEFAFDFTNYDAECLRYATKLLIRS